jgi:tetratricopeptide (TPR) repeat protein
MRPHFRQVGKRFFSGLLFLLLVANAAAQKKIQCPDGEHIEMNLKEISIKYDESSFAGEVNSLYVLSLHMEAVPKKLQEAASATQQWNEFLKGLVVGYNSCAITRDQYANGLTRIYPRLKEDGAELEAFRKQIARNQKVDYARLEHLVDEFYKGLQELAHVSHQDLLLQQIENLSEQENRHHNEDSAKLDHISQQLAALTASNQRAPLASPAQVSNNLHELLQSKAEDAEKEYTVAFGLLKQYRFQEAIPHLRKAIEDVPLPEFYFALGRSYNWLRKLEEAESILRTGLSLQGLQDVQKSRLEGELSFTLLTKGDLDGSLKLAKSVLEIDEKLYTDSSPMVAADLGLMSESLKTKGDLTRALQYAMRSLSIDKKQNVANNLRVAVDMNNVSRILRDQGDLDSALEYSQNALTIESGLLGPNDPQIADVISNIGLILSERARKGDREEAIRYIDRALEIDEKIYGPDHPFVAVNLLNAARIFLAEGNLAQAKLNVDRGLEIDARVYGSSHPAIARDYDLLGQIFEAKGNFSEALRYTKLALEISRRSYGPNHPSVAVRLYDIGEILYEKGELDEALSYLMQAVEIYDKNSAGDNVHNIGVLFTISDVLRAKGDIKGCLPYEERVLRVFQKVYGAHDERTAKLADRIRNDRLVLGAQSN